MSQSNFEIVYAQRKTLCIQVLKDGSVRVRAPYFTPRAVIDKFVAAHSDWIEKAKIKQSEKKSRIDSLTDADVDRLRKLAKEYLPSRVEYYERIMGVKSTGIKITSAKTRFGSCNGKNSLCFSLYLMLYEKRAVDYVVVHELAHIVEKNHSKRFYAVVEKYMPDYKERAKLLKKVVLN